MTNSLDGKELKCSHCGQNILDHVEITFIGCLSALSGEIEVYREHNKKRIFPND